MSNAPQITSHHRSLEKLFGQWQGKETVRMSADAAPVDATARLDIRSAVQGFFVELDWVEEAGGKVVMEGHGVIGWDPKAKEHTLHWFDSYGTPPRTVNTGNWDGNTLTFVTRTETHEGRTSLTAVSDTELAFAVEMKVDGAWLRFVDGAYRRLQ